MAKRKPLTEAQKKQKKLADAARRARAKKGESAARGTKPVGEAPGDQTVERRQLPSKRYIKELAAEMTLAIERASSAQGKTGQLLSEASKQKHVNVEALRIVHRVLRKALRDPMKGRVLYDDIVYYFECVDIEKACGDSLFPAGTGRAEGGEGDGEDDGKVTTLRTGTDG